MVYNIVINLYIYLAILFFKGIFSPLFTSAYEMISYYLFAPCYSFLNKKFF